MLYSRVWQAVLFNKLNPYDGVLHARQPHKPTFVFDVVELFRTQAVDRVVISLIQKGEPLIIEKGLLDSKSVALLSHNLTERLNRYEQYRGKECRLCDIIKIQTKAIASFIESNSLYKPYIAKW
jgi:CRISPR-associated endonuclease Cas1